MTSASTSSTPGGEDGSAAVRSVNRVEGVEEEHPLVDGVAIDSASEHVGPNLDVPALLGSGGQGRQEKILGPARGWVPGHERTEEPREGRPRRGRIAQDRDNLNVSVDDGVAAHGWSGALCSRGRNCLQWDGEVRSTSFHPGLPQNQKGGWSLMNYRMSPSSIRTTSAT